MATTALDPSFGSGGVILGQNIPYVNTAQSYLGEAVAVQNDGKVVATSLSGDPSRKAGGAIQLAIRRDNTDGSVDTTFGTGGQASIPIPTGYQGVGNAPRNLVILPDGSIAFAAQLDRAPTTTNPPPSAFRSIVVRLTPDGRLDPSFGTQGTGEVTLNTQNTTLAVQADGKLVVGGTTAPASAFDNNVLSITRLSSNGALDTTFNATGELDITSPAGSGSGGGRRNDTANRIVVAPGGQIYVAGVEQFTAFFKATQVPVVVGINADGTLNQSFGVGGTASLASGADDLGVQGDGRLIVAGVTRTGPGVSAPNLVSSTSLTRLLPDGSVDPSFFAVRPVAPTSDFQPNDLAATVFVGLDNSITVGGEAYDPSRNQFLVARYRPDGSPDQTFGANGRFTFTTSPSAPKDYIPNVTSVAVASSGKVVVGGQILRFPIQYVEQDSQGIVAQVVPATIRRPAPNDYTGVGKSEVAAELAAFGLFAYRKSTGGDVLQPFGPIGIGQAIPAPGDYDGDGKTDIAAYLPAYGVLAYRPSSGGPDVIVPFGMAGAGKSIPAPGDYDGDGKTDVAVYLPSLGILAYRPSSGGPDVLRQFGMAGSGASIPAPGDYDGDGKTDLAVYLPSLGVFAYRPSSGGPDVLQPFGMAGAGKTIPAPGDYNGDGKTDVAAYLPSLGIFAYRPSGGGADVLTPFGLAGLGASIPAPGDYNGDGKTDVAVYLPSLALFAYRPSGGGSDVIESFGVAGMGQTVPAASIPSAQGPLQFNAPVSAQSVASDASSIPTVGDVINPTAGSTTRKKKLPSRVG